MYIELLSSSLSTDHAVIGVELYIWISNMVVFTECIVALFFLCVLLSSTYKRPKCHVNGILKRQGLKQQTEGEYRGAALGQSEKPDVCFDH